MTPLEWIMLPFALLGLVVGVCFLWATVADAIEQDVRR